MKYNKEELIEVLEKERSIIELLDYRSKYPGNVKSNIVIYKVFVEKYPDCELDKKLFMSLCKLYLRCNNIDEAYCRVCGKICNCKSDYTFFDTCSKECGRVIAGQSTSKTYQTKSKKERDSIKEKRKATNIAKYGWVTNLQSEECLESRKERFNGSISPFNCKDIRDKIKESNAEKHDGLVNSFQWESTKKKSKSTKLERYGNENYVNIEKAKETNNALYGVDSYLETKECKEASRAKAQELYGVDHFSQAQEIKDKVAQMNLERYGKTSYLATAEFREKSIKTGNEKYGVDYNCQRKEVRDKARAVSKINKQWADYLGTPEIEFSIGRYSYDLKKDNILVEINPIITHNCYMSIFKDDVPKDRMYHYNKSKTAQEKGYHCIHIWDWDERDKIKVLLSDKISLYARNLVLKEVSMKDCNLFLKEYHIQNSCNNQDVRLGLYKDDELIEIMTFGKPRYSKTYEWELLRLCTKSEYRVIGGASKLFKYFIDTYTPNSIISYCDMSKFSGTIYTQLGMILLKENLPSKHWYNPKTQRHITDNLLRQRGYSQLHGDKEHKKGESNELLMLEAGYLPLYDSGQTTYIWNK